MKEKNNDKKWLGEKLGRLTVIGFEKKRKGNSGDAWFWKLRCDCGSETVGLPQAVKDGRMLSCGCYKKEQTGKKSKKLKYPINENLRLYRIYHAMKNRCYNEKTPMYIYYGGRGVKVCDEWKSKIDGFDKFADWSMQNGYAETLTIDRIDTNGDYCPENCQWIPMEEQSKNRRNVVWVKYKGETVKLVDLCERLGVDRKLVLTRMRIYGWDVEKAVSEPSLQENSLRRKCLELGVNYQTVYCRIQNGWSEERALKTPLEGKGANQTTYNKC